MKCRKSISLILVSILIFSCADPSAKDGVDDSGQDSGMPSDAGDIDARDTIDAHDVGADGHSDDGGDTEDPDKLTFDAELWTQPNPCEGNETFPAEDEQFSVPQRAPLSQPSTRTRDEIVADFGGLPEHAGWSIRPDETLHPGPESLYDLYAQPGQDVPIHLYVLTPNLRDSHRLNVTVMVDYEPVEASYVRWNAERTDTWLDVVATGVGFAMRSDVEILDIVLPEELFAEERMYEVAVTFNVTTTEGRPGGNSRRFALYYGGYDRPVRPCTEPRLSDSAVDVEKLAMSRGMSDDFVGLLFEGMTEADFQQTIDVGPGETTRFYVSAFRDDFYQGPNPTVLVPLMNGAPIEPAWWITQGEGDNSSDWDTIDARKSFEVTFPETPGIYEVEVATWEDSYELWRTRNGVRSEDISDGGGVTEGSNALRFRVVEPQSE